MKSPFLVCLFVYLSPESSVPFSVIIILQILNVKVDGIQSIGRKVNRDSFFTVEGGKKEKKRINNLLGLVADRKGSLHFKAPTFFEIGR